VGKTTLSAVTGLACAERGLRTLVMSLDPAHSLSDAFDLPGSLMDNRGGAPAAVTENLDIQELDLQRELDDNWGEVFRYIASLIQTTGIRDVLAEELAILPGMEEIACLLHINRYAREQEYDVVVLDCAPTGESMRFISLPTSLEWYMRKIFNLERNIFRVVRPVAKRLTSVPLPSDAYFKALQSLFQRLEGVETLLQDPEVTTVRLVTNAEKMVLKETQRAFTYFHLFDLTVDAVVVNRILPKSAGDGFFQGWRESQQDYLEDAASCFAPVPIWRVELGRREMVGVKALRALARKVFGRRDPSTVFFRDKAFEFAKDGAGYSLTIRTPFLESNEIDVIKDGDELILRIGSFKRFVALPRRVAALEPEGAALEDGVLRVTFGGSDDGEERE
jgi:arsenite-transporting ATPase